jgi:hypothetical protein
MQKVLLVSILIATIAIPLRASLVPDRTKAFRRMDRLLLVFCVLYTASLVVLYPWLGKK